MASIGFIMSTYEPRCEKTGPRGVRPGTTQTELCNHRRCLEAGNFGFRKKRYCTITAKLICVFVYAYAKSRFSHNEAHI